MSLQAHIERLRERHGHLESQLSELMASPSASDDELAEVKRQKLRVKDEITRLQSEAA